MQNLGEMLFVSWKPAVTNNLEEIERQLSMQRIIDKPFTGDLLFQIIGIL